MLADGPLVTGRGPRPGPGGARVHPAAGRRHRGVPEALHQRDPGAERRQPHQDRQGPRRGPTHHLPPPREARVRAARRPRAARSDDRRGTLSRAASRIGALLLAALAGGAVLGGCPIPQPLPGVGSIDGGLPITPPRVLTDSAEPGLAMTDYGPLGDACPPGSALRRLGHRDRREQRGAGGGPLVRGLRPGQPAAAHAAPDRDPAAARRSPAVQALPEALPLLALGLRPAHRARPRGRDDHLERLPARGRGGPAGDLPNRTAAPGYEVQIFRWTFQPSPDGRLRALGRAAVYLVGCAASRAWDIASAAARARSPCSSAKRFTWAV